MDATIVRELGMKGGGNDPTGTHQDGIGSEPPENLDPGSDTGDFRRANEDALIAVGMPECGVELDLRDSRVNLASVGVAFDIHVEQP